MSLQEQIDLKPKSQAEPVAPAPSSHEDSGSQALAEALRNSFFIIKFVMIGLALVFLGSGFFMVHSQERAMILRFGKPVGEGEKAILGPGPHWAFPRPIDEVVKIPISTMQTVNSTIGWYFTTPEAEAAKSEPLPGPSLNPASDGYTITADTNMIHVRATLRYRITDPIRFHFDFSNPAGFLTNALDNALVYASTRFNVDDARIGKASAFKEAVSLRVAELVQDQRLGVSVEQLDITAIPPRQLAAKFSEVGEAQVKSDDAHNKAESYANEVLSKARAEAESRVNTAQAERTRLVSMVQAEAKKFTEFLPQYNANPELFVRVRQTEALEKILGAAQEKLFVPSRADGKPRELRLQLSREPQKPASATAQP